MNKIKIYKNFPLVNFSTFKIGGNADYFCMPSTLSEIIEALKFADERKIKYFIIGGGANILISDNGFRGMIISSKKLKRIRIEGVMAQIESGILLDELNKKLIRRSLLGMEFSGGLPGTLGGAVFMNAKAYGGDFSEIVESVEILNENLKVENLNIQDLDYSYKNSIFMKRKNIFIYRIGLKLKKGNKKEIRDIYKKNIDDRIGKGQFDFPSAGCVFKNNYDIGISTGKIIEEIGMKNTCIGGAVVYEKHANFIINKNNAKAIDVLNLIKLIEKKVYEKKGIILEREVQLLGFDE